jgi:hypothetical protein
MRREVFPAAFPCSETVAGKKCVNGCRHVYDDQFLHLKSKQGPRQDECRISSAFKAASWCIEWAKSNGNPEDGQSASWSGLQLSLLTFRVFSQSSSMEQSPSWETISHSANQEIPHLLWNQNVHYCFHNSPLIIPILSQMNPVHIFPLYFRTIRYNIILPSTPRSYAWFLPFRLSDQIFLCISHLSHVCYMSHQCHPPWLDSPNNIL